VVVVEELVNNVDGMQGIQFGYCVHLRQLDSRILTLVYLNDDNSLSTYILFYSTCNHEDTCLQLGWCGLIGEVLFLISKAIMKC